VTFKAYLLLSEVKLASTQLRQVNEVPENEMQNKYCDTPLHNTIYSTIPSCMG